MNSINSGFKNSFNAVNNKDTETIISKISEDFKSENQHYKEIGKDKEKEINIISHKELGDEKEKEKEIKTVSNKEIGNKKEKEKEIDSNKEYKINVQNVNLALSIAWKTTLKKEWKRDLKKIWKKNYVEFNEELKINPEEKWKNNKIVQNKNLENYWKEYLKKFILYLEEYFEYDSDEMQLHQEICTDILYKYLFSHHQLGAFVHLFLLVRSKIKIIIVYKLLLNDIDIKKDLFKEVMTKETLLNNILKILMFYSRKYDKKIKKIKKIIDNYLMKIILEKMKEPNGNDYFGFIFNFVPKDKPYLNELAFEVMEIFRKKNQTPKKELFMIKNQRQLKIGNSVSIKSIRNDNQINMIIRNLIQKVFLDWINYGETDNSKKLYKIDPVIFGKKNFFKGKKLKEIYSEKISEKGNSNNDHNVKIIKSATGIKNIKLNYSFGQALKFFYYKNNFGEDLSKTINIDENKENISRAIILEGLIEKEEYINRKTRGENSSYRKKLLLNLDTIKKNFIE